MTGKPEHDVTTAVRSKVNLDALFRDVRPIRSVDELAAPEVFESEEELDEFLAAVRTDRGAGLA